jgi:hypothetical protein
VKKLLLLAILCGFLVTAAIGCGGSPTTKAPDKAPAPATPKAGS